MKTVLRSLQDLSPAMLRAVAESHGLVLTSQTPRLLVEQLAAALADAQHLAQAVAACSPEARAALAQLAHEGGRMPAAVLERRFGAIRPIGPGRLDRERPQRNPANASEALWYLGLIHRTFAETPQGLVEFLFVPLDLLPLLPTSPVRQARFGLPGAGEPVAVQPRSDELLHDVCSLLCLVQAGEVRLSGSGDPLAWRSSSLYALSGLMLQPVEAADLVDDRAPGSFAALAFVLSGELGWLRADGNTIRLHARPVEEWLLASRTEQRRTLLDAWRSSTRWNDLCRVPGLSCEETGSWANDPLFTRARLLPLLGELAPGVWHALDDLLVAVHTHAADFQRPDGDYGSWYIRRRSDPVFLRGYEHWDAVEGELLRFLVNGPLHWLGALDSGVDSAGRPLFRLNQEGAVWLAGEASLPPPVDVQGRLTVQADFAVATPGDAPLMDRFRVARFTTWEGVRRAPALEFRYRISQTGLRRAARQGVSAQRVLAFLQERCGDDLPANVAAALAGWQ